MTLKKTLTVLLFCMFYTISNGQETSAGSNGFLDVAVSLNIGGTKFLSNNEFLNSLRMQNLPVTFDKITLGFNTDLYIDKLRPSEKLIPVIGVSYFTARKSDRNISTSSASVSNDYNMDYVVWNYKGQYFYPGLGIGWENFNYNFVDHSNVPSSYPDALQDFSGERTIQSGALTYLNISANYDISIIKSNDMFLGLHASYHLGLNHKNLQLGDGTSLDQSARLKASSLSVGLALTIE